MVLKLVQSPGQKANKLFTVLVLIAALLSFVILVSIIISLIAQSLPIFKEQGFGFLFDSTWNVPKKQFGALAPIYGTVITSVIAIFVAVPISILIAYFLTAICPDKLKRLTSSILELLAAIPSIVFGMFALYVLAPYFSEYFEIPLQVIFGNIPFVGALFGGPTWGTGILASGVILAIMIIPYISSVVKDVFETTPTMLVESAYGIGMTSWEVTKSVVLSYGKNGVISAVMLGLGRALGETMAITFIIGNSFRLDDPSLFSQGVTITSAIANGFAEASNELHTSALISLGLILFTITFMVLMVSKIIIKIMNKRAGY